MVPGGLGGPHAATGGNPLHQGTLEATRPGPKVSDTTNVYLDIINIYSDIMKINLSYPIHYNINRIWVD